MLARALAAFVALPGIVAYAVPLLLVRWSGDPRPFHTWGLVPLGLGTAMLLRCVWDFYAAGRGTLAPWTPPARLVTVGLYRWSRNPMYIAVSLVLLGWALVHRSAMLLGYAVAVMAAFHLRVVVGEEPWLDRRFGEAWRRYASRVPRWL